MVMAAMARLATLTRICRKNSISDQSTGGNTAGPTVHDGGAFLGPYDGAMMQKWQQADSFADKVKFRRHNQDAQAASPSTLPSAS